LNGLKSAILKDQTGNRKFARSDLANLILKELQREIERERRLIENVITAPHKKLSAKKKTKRSRRKKG
jgi:hypothetical protein